jgi:hypothetical protein
MGQQFTSTLYKKVPYFRKCSTCAKWKRRTHLFRDNTMYYCALCAPEDIFKINIYEYTSILE